MQLHNLPGKHLRKKRVGRGGKRGTYAGRGVKGQKARAGHRIRPAIRDLIKQIPKLRGYAFKRVSQKPALVTLGILERNFQAGDLVSPATLHRKGLITVFGARRPTVKILAGGKLTKKLAIRKCALSSSARQAIERAGGQVMT